MFELFIGLAGIIFIISALNKEKRADKKYNEYITDRDNKQKRFESIVKDDDLELLVNEKLRDPSRHEEVRAELRDVFSAIPSCVGLENDLNLYNSCSFDYDMAKRILMARAGKIPWPEYFLDSKSIDIPIQTPESNRVKRKKFKDLLTWVEKELKRNGVPVRLKVFCSTPDPRIQSEIYWDCFDDPTEHGALTENILSFGWSYETGDLL